MHPGHEIASLTRYGAGPIEDIALVRGHLYLGVTRAMLAGFRAMGCVLDHAGVTENQRADRLHAHDLRTWLFASLHTARRGESERKAESSVAGWQSGERLPTPVVEESPP